MHRLVLRIEGNDLYAYTKFGDDLGQSSATLPTSYISGMLLLFRNRFRKVLNVDWGRNSKVEAKFHIFDSLMQVCPRGVEG